MRSVQQAIPQGSECLQRVNLQAIAPHRSLEMVCARLTHVVPQIKVPCPRLRFPIVQVKALRYQWSMSKICVEKCPWMVRFQTRDCVLVLRNRLSFLIPLALLISFSCSRNEKTPDASVKDPAGKTAVALPLGAMPLSAVLKAVEGADYAPVVAVEFEKDHWEVKAYRNGQLLQLKVSLLAGDILPNSPPPLDKPLSAVVKDLEDQGYGPIIDVERDAEGTDSWEVEGYKGQTAITVRVEPASGKITPK